MIKFKDFLREALAKAEAEKPILEANLATFQTVLKECFCAVAIKNLAGVEKIKSQAGSVSAEQLEGEMINLAGSCLCKRDQDDLVKAFGKVPMDFCLTHGYLESAIETAKVFFKNFNSGYDIERQRSGLSKQFYADSRKFGAGTADNWNPADLWCFSNFDEAGYKEFVKELIATPADKESKLTVFNKYFLDQIDKRIILPVSLKKIEGKNGDCKLMVSEKLRDEVPGAQELHGVGVEEIANISLMANSQCPQVASAFTINFKDSEYFFQFWEKARNGFTVALHSATNSNDKSGINKKYIKGVLPGFDNISGLYGKNKINVEQVKGLVEKLEKNQFLKNPELLKTTFDYMKDENNWKEESFKSFGILNKALYTIQNLSVMADTISEPGSSVLRTMLLSGLKMAEWNCPHFKIF